MLQAQDWIEKTTEHIKTVLADDSTGHDWWHIYRVHKLAKYIAEQEKADTLVVELAALLHDISDWKLNGGDEKAGGRVATEWLASIEVDRKVSQKVAHIIDNTSFKGAGVKDKTDSLEGKIL